MKTRIILPILITLVTQGSISAGPTGALLMHENIRYGHYNVPKNAAHHFFDLVEGPAWENKYCAFRMYIDMDDRNAIDIFGKLTEGSVLQDFNDASDDPHTLWSWGTDILKVGSAMGFGSFRLFQNGQWLNPQLPETIDSLVITIADSSVETPRLQIGYYGWNIGSGNKITVLWTLSTSFEERATHCEVSIDGDYSGKVVAGMVNHNENTSNPYRSSVSVIQDEAPPLLATLGKQAAMPEGYDDSLLMAIFTESRYFDSFEKQGSTNLGMVLKPDDENKVRWSFAYSWAREKDPIFRYPNWKQMLVPVTAIIRKTEKQPISFVNDQVSYSTNIPAIRYSLNGRMLGKRYGSENCVGQHARGVYIVQIGENGNGKGSSIFRRISTQRSGK